MRAAGTKQTSNQKLIVRPDGQLSFGSDIYRCALGRGGRSAKKTEGDGVTPVGLWRIHKVYYRPDKLAAPDTGLPVVALSENDGWCDDPAHADYNRPVTLPHVASCEKLWRDDAVYDIVVTLGYNDDPVMPGAGSAIFFHLAGAGFEATEGCVAVAREDMLTILKQLAPEDLLEILEVGQAGG